MENSVQFAIAFDFLKRRHQESLDAGNGPLQVTLLAKRPNLRREYEALKDEGIEVEIVHEEAPAMS